jgi:hypothetical protein
VTTRGGGRGRGLHQCTWNTKEAYMCIIRVKQRNLNELHNREVVGIGSQQSRRCCGVVFTVLYLLYHTIP